MLQRQGGLRALVTMAWPKVKFRMVKMQRLLRSRKNGARLGGLLASSPAPVGAPAGPKNRGLLTMFPAAESVRNPWQSQLQTRGGQLAAATTTVETMERATGLG